MATTLLNADENPCHICCQQPSRHSFKCCFRNEEMKLCRDCIESLVMRKLIAEIAESRPIDLSQSYKLQCPFCRQNYDMIYDSTGWGEYMIEDFVNLGQSIVLIKLSKEHYREEIETLRTNLRDHHHSQMAGQRRRMTEEVLLPLTRLLNVEHRRIIRLVTPRR